MDLRCTRQPCCAYHRNDVVFALAIGKFLGDGDVSNRIHRSTSATHYALNAETGKEIWNSGKTITSFVHSAALAASPRQVYVGTYGDTLYAFGFFVPRQ
jgi:outer membrane protein assembly factor BamB